MRRMSNSPTTRHTIIMRKLISLYLITSKAAKFTWLLCFSGIFIFSASPSEAQLINVDFNNDSFGAAHGGPNPGPTMSGAAVLGAPGDQWNGINVNSGTGIPLIYANGSNSPVTMTFTSGGGYDANAFSGSTPFAGTPYDALMEDYLFNGGTPRTNTLSGLTPNSFYNLVLYNAADQAAAGRITLFTVNGNTQSSTWNASSSNFVAGIDYVEFNPAFSDASGNLVITWTGNGSAEGDIDGFQLQLLPPMGPLVTTTNPTNNNGTNVTFSAIVNPVGQAATCYFEYGSTTNYGSFSPTNALSATNAFLNVGILVGGLQPLSPYHYRIVAADSFGTSYGKDISFTTASAFVPIAPAGARISRQSISNNVSNPGQSNVYMLPLTAGQNLSLLITPAPGFWPSVELTDPSGAPFGSADALAPGETLLFNNSPILVSGTYSLSVSGINGSTGSYSLQMLLNAAFEGESYLDEPNNDLFAAENLVPSAFAAGTGKGEEMAVVGNLAGRPSLLWPDPVDVYRFFLNAGDSATLVANNLTAGQLQLQLENGSGQTVAFSGSDANNVSQYIDGFIAPTSEYYYAAITGTSNVQYSLVVTRNAEFNLEPDDFFRPGQSLFGFQTLIGHLEANASDYYSVPANIGDHLAFSTATPTSGPSEIQNGLYPELLLYDPNGNLVAIASGNASDGRNSVIDFTVPSGDAGQWSIEVTASASTPNATFGDYLLTVTGDTGSPNPFVVSSTMPVAGALVAPTATITLGFNQQVYGGSLTPGELEVNGVRATAVALTGPDLATWTIPAAAYATGTDLPNVVTLGVDQTGHQMTALNSTTLTPFSYTFYTSTSLTPPTAGPDTITDMENTLVNIPESFLLSNDSSPINGPLSITGVNSTSGATVASLNGSSIAYTPPPGFAGVDTFTYTLSDGHLTATGLVTVYVTRTGAPPFGDLTISGVPADLMFTFSGIPGRQYDLMYATSVTGPWMELYPVFVTDPTGFAQYTNITASPPPTRFFRAQSLPW